MYLLLMYEVGRFITGFNVCVGKSVCFPYTFRSLLFVPLFEITTFLKTVIITNVNSFGFYNESL